MGVINRTTEDINTLLDKVEHMPEEGVIGKTPVLETGETVTLPAGSEATSEVIRNGEDSNGNPKYKLNFGIPKGRDGSGGGGVIGSVSWADVVDKPSWVNSSTKPSYSASEVGALPIGTTIPTKTSQLSNDSNFISSSNLKSINGESLVGSGNIEISGGSGGGIPEAPSDGKIYGRKNKSWVVAEIQGSNIMDLVNRVSQAASASTKISQEDYDTLQRLSLDGTLVYASAEGQSVRVSIAMLPGLLVITSDIPSGEIGVASAQFFISSDLSVAEYSGSIIYGEFVSSSVNLTNYSKKETYEEILPTDTINTAIGKLEAGLTSASGSSSEDVLYIENTSISKIKVSSTQSELENYLGGNSNLKVVYDSVNAGKKVVFRKRTSLGYYIEAQAATSVGKVMLLLTIPINGIADLESKSKIVTISISASLKVKLEGFVYTKGYRLSNGIDALTKDSTDDDVKAVLSTSDLQEILALSKFGCIFKLPITTGVYAGSIVDVTVAIVEDSVSNTILLSITGLVYGLFESTGFGVRMIKYDISSNTYEVIG